MVLVHKFINLAPDEQIDAANLRREVRSHAARASANHERGVHKGGRRRRYRRSLTWPVRIQGEVEAPSDEIQSDPVTTLSVFAGNDVTIPASHSPVYHQPFVSLVLENYLEHLAVAIPEIDGPGHSALLRTSWFPMVIHNPMIFQVIMLFSASHYAARCGDITLAPTILYLKQCAIAGIVNAVSGLNGQAGDDLIAAIAKMASYEAIYGTETAYHAHMKGVEKMLRLRGGLSVLGLDGFLSRLLIFIDTNSAFLLNTHLYLQDSAFPRLAPFVMPNPGRFIGAS